MTQEIDIAALRKAAQWSKYCHWLSDQAFLALLDRLEQAEKDAARYLGIKAILERSVGGGIDVNEWRLCYEDQEPGKEVRLYWYPDTPIGFYEIHGSTIDEVADEVIAFSMQGDGA